MKNNTTHKLIIVFFLVCCLGCNWHKKDETKQKDNFYGENYYPFNFPSINMTCFIPKVMNNVCISFYGNADTLGNYSEYTFYDNREINPDYLQRNILEVTILLVKPSYPQHYESLYKQKIAYGISRIKEYNGKMIDDTATFRGEKVNIVARMNKSRTVDDSAHYVGNVTMICYGVIGEFGIIFKYSLTTNDTSLVDKRVREALYCFKHLDSAL